MSNYFIGKQEIDGPRDKGDPIRRYYFDCLDTPIHYHEDFEIIRVTNGKIQYHIGIQEISAQKDDILLVTPYVLHSGVVKDKRFSVSVYVIKPSLLSSQNEYINKFFDPLINRQCFLPPLIKKGEKAQDKLLLCLDKIDEIEKKKELGFELEIRNELSKFFLILQRNEYIIETNANENKNETIIKKAISYIEQNYSHHISVNEIANKFGFSESHFMAIFKKHTGRSFVSYLNRIRIEKAISLLKRSQLSIIEISERTGFNSISLFNRTFKKITNKTPKEYR